MRVAIFYSVLEVFPLLALAKSFILGKTTAVTLSVNISSRIPNFTSNSYATHFDDSLIIYIKIDHAHVNYD